MSGNQCQTSGKLQHKSRPQSAASSYRNLETTSTLFISSSNLKQFASCRVYFKNMYSYFYWFNIFHQAPVMCPVTVLEDDSSVNHSGGRKKSCKDRIWEILNTCAFLYGSISEYMYITCLCVYMYAHKDNGGFLAQSCLTLGTPWTIAQQAPLSMRFPR